MGFWVAIISPSEVTVVGCDDSVFLTLLNVISTEKKILKQGFKVMSTGYVIP